MSYMAPTEPEQMRGDRIVVQLLRRYAASCDIGEQVLPPMVEVGSRFGLTGSAVVAFASVFEITEACLGRRLVTSCCSERALGSDERAVLQLFACAGDAGPVHTTRTVPHGLPGVLVWAVASANRLWKSDNSDRDFQRAADRCPFGVTATTAQPIV